MKYFISGLLLLASLTVAAEKKPKCPGKLKLKAGDTYYDNGTKTNFKCECKEGTGKAADGTETQACEPVLYQRKYDRGADKQTDWTPVEKPE
jgi:hypothetical protein